MCYSIIPTSTHNICKRLTSLKRKNYDMTSDGAAVHFFADCSIEGNDNKSKSSAQWCILNSFTSFTVLFWSKIWPFKWASHFVTSIHYHMVYVFLILTMVNNQLYLTLKCEFVNNLLKRTDSLTYCMNEFRCKEKLDKCVSLWLLNCTYIYIYTL